MTRSWIHSVVRATAVATLIACLPLTAEEPVAVDQTASGLATSDHAVRNQPAIGQLDIDQAAINQAPTASAIDQRIQRLSQSAAPAFVFIGGGSGVVICPSGLFLTNHHVSGDQEEWQVRVNGSLVVAHLVGKDPHGDIALYRLRDGAPHPFVTLGDSEGLAIGDPVIAIGNPFGAAGRRGDPTVTVGRITAKNRSVSTYSDALQTDASVNPGNSGGPLLDRHGHLVGINGRISTRHGSRSNTGIGHAIPVDQIRRFLPTLIQSGGRSVYHGIFRGLTFASEEDVMLRDGAIIDEVRPGSPAAAVGLRAKQRITAIDGRPVHNSTRLQSLLFAYPGGSPVELTVVSEDGTIRQLPIILEVLVPGTIGMAMGPAGEPGLRVNTVAAGGAAELAGLKPADLIIAINGEAVATVRDAQRSLSGNQLLAGDHIDLRVRRDGQELDIVLVLMPQF